MVDADLCQRILSDLESILRKHPLLESFDVISTSDDHDRANRSPVFVVENHLGLDSWCLVPVYVAAHDELLECQDQQKLLQFSNFVLLINPELEAGWSCRKKLYIQKKCSFQQELQLSHLALSRKPKTAEAFYHRKWVLSQEMENYTLERRQAILHSELQLCDTMAGKYFSNYHAWDYRRHLLKEYVEGAPLIVESELQRSKEFLQSHVSDYSGMSYRQYVLLRVNSRPLFESELTFASELIHTFPGHEALWNHRRFCVLANIGLLKWAEKRQRMIVKENKDPKKLENAKQIEQSFLEEVLRESGAWQTTLCERHVRWAQATLHIDIAPASMLTNGSSSAGEGEDAGTAVNAAVNSTAADADADVDTGADEN